MQKQKQKVTQLIKALRCSSSSNSYRDCDTCPYWMHEEFDKEWYDLTGEKEWNNCDVDRIGLDAADLLEAFIDGKRS